MICIGMSFGGNLDLAGGELAGRELRCEMFPPYFPCAILRWI